ncbi:hypothetical protein BSKO_03614 [Bryopsis sp. KO-2023]|nr:hypothetical protein BSKO_03614 [Bryopsis sp. KO-2023]
MDDAFAGGRRRSRRTTCQKNKGRILMPLFSLLRGKAAPLGVLLACLWSITVLMSTPVSLPGPGEGVHSSSSADFFVLASRVLRAESGTSKPAGIRLLKRVIGSMEAEDDGNFSGNRTEVDSPWGLHSQLRDILSQISRKGDILPCQRDKDLLEGAQPTGTFFFALNLYNNEAIMPNLIYQLLRTISRFPEGRVAVSIYESGSLDSTPQWLALFRELLDFFEIRNRVIMGGMVRKPEEERIEFLAKVRNEALQPLVEWKASSDWIASKVIFLNDIFFCPQDVLRLLRNDGDIVCGLDFIRAMGGLTKGEQREIMVKDLVKNMGFYQSVADGISRNYWILKQWRRFLGKRDAVLGELPLVFYDKWVSHDAMGLHFLNNAPYVQDEYGKDRIKRGLPFPVDACWNGMVVLDAKPFFAGIRSRGHLEGECSGSECFLMCQDFIRLGYDDIVVDPGVRVAYTFQDASDVFSEHVRGIEWVDWKEVQHEKPLRKIAQQKVVECCALLAGEDSVDFNRNCYQFDVFDTNYTLLSLVS